MFEFKNAVVTVSIHFADDKTATGDIQKIGSVVAGRQRWVLLLNALKVCEFFHLAPCRIDDFCGRLFHVARYRLFHIGLLLCLYDGGLTFLHDDGQNVAARIRFFEG